MIAGRGRVVSSQARTMANGCLDAAAGSGQWMAEQDGTMEHTGWVVESAWTDQQLPQAWGRRAPAGPSQG
jgi:hypothetical protein